MQSLETIIHSHNAVNRKLEELLSGGLGVESIAELWGRFSELMAQTGAPEASEENVPPAT